MQKVDYIAGVTYFGEGKSITFLFSKNVFIGHQIICHIEQLCCSRENPYRRSNKTPNRVAM